MALLLRDKPQEQAPSRTPARSSVAEVFESNFMNLKQMFCNSIKPLCFASIGLMIAGCASSGVKNPSGVPVTEMRADERGFVAGTGVESQDLVTVSDQIARKILSTPEIMNAQGTPRVGLLPVVNNTRFAINKDIFLTRIRGQLNERASGKVRFVARDVLSSLEQERTLKQTGQVTASSDPHVQEFKGVDFFLKGSLDGLSTRTAAGTSDYILYSFQLVDARTSDIIFEGQHEIKKQGLEDAAYR